MIRSVRIQGIAARTRAWLAGIPVLCLMGGVASAQVGGSHGGIESGVRADAPRLSPEVAGSFIAIEGTSEIRLPADGLRVVFAIATDAETPIACWARQRARRESFLAALAQAGISSDVVQVDFISILPVFGWKQETHDGQSVLVEHLTGLRVQENVHVAVADETAANRVIELALGNGVQDVVAVEYWSAVAVQKRRESLEAALAAAKSKADLLLASFEKRPALANVTERTDVLEPDRLYVSFETAYESSADHAWRGDLPRLMAVRPKNTWYAGFDGRVDSGPTAPRMKPEISIVSTVVLYFESPALGRMASRKDDDR